MKWGHVILSVCLRIESMLQHHLGRPFRSIWNHVSYIRSWRNYACHVTDHATWCHVNDGVSVRVTANCTVFFTASCKIKLSYKSHSEADFPWYQNDSLQVRTRLDLQVEVQATGPDRAILVSATWKCNNLKHSSYDFGSGLHHHAESHSQQDDTNWPTCS